MYVKRSVLLLIQLRTLSGEKIISFSITVSCFTSPLTRVTRRADDPSLVKTLGLTRAGPMGANLSNAFA